MHTAAEKHTPKASFFFDPESGRHAQVVRVFCKTSPDSADGVRSSVLLAARGPGSPVPWRSRVIDTSSAPAGLLLLTIAED